MKIRYHHLLCIPRFEGKGYSKEFCDNMEAVKKSFLNGDYELTEGTDDVCCYCPNLIDGKCITYEKTNKYDNAVKEFIANKVVPTPDAICNDCEWYYICKNK